MRDVAQLAAAAGDAPLTGLSRAQLARTLAILHGRGLSGRSLARMLSAWRAFYRFSLTRDRALADDPCAGLKAPKSGKRLPSALTPDEAVQLVAIDGDDLLSVRDRALFELAYSSGLRLSELAGLDIDRMDLIGGEVRVWGKGAKERVVPVGAPAREAIAVWLVQRAPLAADDERALFIGVGGRRISARTIERRLAAWAIKRGLHRHVHPHMLRHSFASHVLQSSGDLRRPGDAGARVDREHAGVHASRFPGARQGVRRSAPAGKAEEIGSETTFRAYSRSSRPLFGKSPLTLFVDDARQPRQPLQVGHADVLARLLEQRGQLAAMMRGMLEKLRRRDPRG